MFPGNLRNNLYYLVIRKFSYSNNAEIMFWHGQKLLNKWLNSFSVYFE